MAVTPWDSIAPDHSPFVGMFMLTGLPAAASVVNFVVLTSAASSANSGMFSTSRMLYGLAEQHVAHRRFCPAVAPRRADQRPVVLLPVPGCRGGVDLPDSQRHDGLYPGDHGVGDSVYVRLDHYSLLLSRLS